MNEKNDFKLIMDTAKLCRCCLTEGIHKDLYLSYTWFDKNEVYSDMLKQCFDIVLLNKNSSSNGICEACIKDLRNSLRFKQEVVKSEQEFLKRIQDECVTDQKNIEVKIEVKLDDSDDSDDYFLADAVSSHGVNIADIKIEPEEPSLQSKSSTKRQKHKDGKKPERKGNDIIKRLSNLPELNIRQKNNGKKIVIKRETIAGKRVKLLWSGRSDDAKSKHRENLITILKFSNARIFRDKSLLGYICGYCDEAYPDPADLKSHIETKHKSIRLDFKCRRFDITEYSTKLDVAGLLCNLCNENLNNLSAFKEHIVKAHSKTFHMDIDNQFIEFKLKKGEQYDCAMCSSTYETFKMLKQHMNKHYPNYTCGKCDATFATNRSLRAHITTHEEGSFKCEYCDKVFSNKGKKQYHEKNKHFGTRHIANCPHCNITFNNYYQRNQHLIKVHNTEALYKCNICDKGYILKSLLMYHIKKNHLMEKNFQCTDCGYRFFSKKALRAHMVKHTGERIYNCEVCNKSYARKYTLREHMRIHNDDRRFKCVVCGTSFVQKCSLKSHLLSNHGMSVAASDIAQSQ